jgi:hypothetical protein
MNSGWFLLHLRILRQAASQAFPSGLQSARTVDCLTLAAVDCQQLATLDLGRP